LFDYRQSQCPGLLGTDRSAFPACVDHLESMIRSGQKRQRSSLISISAIPVPIIKVAPGTTLPEIQPVRLIAFVLFGSFLSRNTKVTWS
jgi:hypothetical protein